MLIAIQQAYSLDSRLSSAHEELLHVMIFKPRKICKFKGHHVPHTQGEPGDEANWLMDIHVMQQCAKLCKSPADES